MIRVVDNKKLDMTDDEYTLFNKICRSYDDPYSKGELLFSGLFETNDDGIIMFLIPPEKTKTTLQIYLFLMSLMMQQHLRYMHKRIDDAVLKAKNDKS